MVFCDRAGLLPLLDDVLDREVSQARSVTHPNLGNETGHQRAYPIQRLREGNKQQLDWA